MSDNFPDDVPESVQYAPSYSVEAEQSVLGGLLTDNSAYDKIADRLRPEHFYRADHREMYQTALVILHANRPLDAVTMAEALDQNGRLDFVGGLPYLAALAQNVPSAANIARYADIVRERAMFRELMATMNDMYEIAQVPGNRSAAEVIDLFQGKLQGLADLNDRVQQNARTETELMQAVVARIEALYQQEGKDITGIDTGYPAINALTAGWQPGDLIILAGRPSMGKTALALNFGMEVALSRSEPKPILIFSMEMSGEQLMARITSAVGDILSDRLKRAAFEDDDWEKLTHAVRRITDGRFLVDESSSLNPIEIRTRARRYQRQIGQPLGLIVIDYLQLMSAVNPSKNGNRVAELSEITRSLKGLAKELHVPVIALSQLSRDVEKRHNKRPVMSDLRDSGSLEQDADMVVLLYRDDYYNPDSDQKGIVEVNFAKHRNGPTGTVPLYFRNDVSRFETLARGGPLFS